jgi:REP element-mobilizing transposase RayT
MGKMHLSPVGVFADLLWHEIKNHSKNVTLGEFVVMPNHIHGILVLTGDGDGGDGDGGNVETGHALSLRHAPSPSPSQPSSPSQSPPPPTIGQQRFQNIGKNSVSSIIGGYKSAITKHANRLGLKFAWQPLFYEHIIRDEKAFQNISHYILNNPFNWVEDRFCFKRQK